MKIEEAAAIYRQSKRPDFSHRLNRRIEEMAEVLEEVAQKELSPEQREDIELILDANVRRKYRDKKTARKALNSINKLFFKHFQFVSRNHYRTVYTTLCFVASMIFGTLLLSIRPVYFIPTVTLGIIIGFWIGSKYDQRAAQEGRVIEAW